MNQALRNHVTSTSFSLSLRAAHIEALVWFDQRLARDLAVRDAWRAAREKAAEEIAEFGITNAEACRLSLIDLHYRAPWVADPGQFPRAWSASSGALMRRGLVAFDERKMLNGNASFADSWRFTEAGRLVIGLLKEAGIWQEYAAKDVPPPPPGPGPFRIEMGAAT
jgi:hypothetical protein